MPHLTHVWFQVLQIVTELADVRPEAGLMVLRTMGLQVGYSPAAALYWELKGEMA